MTLTGNDTGRAQQEAEEPPRPVNVKVQPRSGGPRTRFRIAFRAKNEAAGPRYYGLLAWPRKGSDCPDRLNRFFEAERGETVAFRAPRRSPAKWCPATYEGIVFLEREQPEGGTYLETVVGEFSFRVTRRR